MGSMSLNHLPRTAAVISLHFSPAHASHMAALGRLLQELGFEVTFLVAPGYLSFPELSSIARVEVFSSRAFNLECQGFGLAVFCNAALRNSHAAGRMSHQGVKILYVFHEPGEMRKQCIEDWMQAMKFPIATLCSIAMLRRSSAVIVPSENAKNQYNRLFSKYNRNAHAMPLMFDDELGWERVKRWSERKKCFSFLGGAGKGHGFEDFTKFAKYAIVQGCTFPFRIITRTRLSSRFLEDPTLARAMESGQLTVEHGRVFSNEEMNQACLESFCVWNVYRRSTQSGVLPRAFMAGTPVLARRIGSFPEYVIEGKTGEWVDTPCDFEGMLRTVERMKDRVALYVENCRSVFMSRFFYRSNLRILSKILASIATKQAPGRGHDNSICNAASLRSEHSWDFYEL